MNTPHSPTPALPWTRALLAPEVWRKAAPVGLGVGVLQIALNQGDYWLQGQVTTGIVIKTLLCPAISLGIALYSAASVYRHTAL